jgi:pentachlorophenol monooxygenase
LLESYDAERKPVGEEVVGRTVRSAREGIGADSTDPDFVIRREAQLLISYAASPIVDGSAGGRAPDARGLTRAMVADPIRLFTLLGRRGHTVLLYAGPGPCDTAAYEATAEDVLAAGHGTVDAYLIAHRNAEIAATALPVIRDAAGDFARMYEVAGPAVIVVRPDGYVSFAAAGIDAEPVTTHLHATFA